MTFPHKSHEEYTSSQYLHFQAPSQTAHRLTKHPPSTLLMD